MFLTRVFQAAHQAPATSAAVTSASPDQDRVRQKPSVPPTLHDARQRARLVNWRTEAIAAPRERLDEPRRVGSIAQRRLDLRDAEVQAALEVDEGAVAPDFLAERVPGDDVAGMKRGWPGRVPAAAAAEQAHLRGSAHRYPRRTRKDRNAPVRPRLTLAPSGTSASCAFPASRFVACYRRRQTITPSETYQRDVKCARGWPRTGAPLRAAGPTLVTEAFGPEHEVGLFADRTRQGHFTSR